MLGYLLHYKHFLAELRRGPPGGAPYSYMKEKESQELIFSRLSWLAVLLVGAYARGGGGGGGGVVQDGDQTPNNWLTWTCSLGLPCTSFLNCLACVRSVRSEMMKKPEKNQAK